MTQQLSLKDYQAALKGNTVTLGWDVVVCYTARELNALLGAQWPAAGTTSVQIKKVYKRFRTQTFYDLQLGTPVLQFNASAFATATLKCSIDGTYRNDTIDKDGNIIEIGTEINHIPHAAYILDIEVPIRAVHADGNLEEDSRTIVFASDKEAESYIIFHFQNAEDTSFKVSKIDAIPHDEDDQIIDISGKNGELSAWFSNRDNLQWINIAIAQITNKKAPANATDKISDLLRPKSFCFTTQSNSDGGVLLLFMQTEGSGSQPGNPVPYFNAPSRSQENILAIPSGSHAAIIINHDLFLKKFLREQLSSKFGTTVQAVDTSEGFKLICPLAQVQTEFKSSGGNWVHRFLVDGIKIDFTKDLLSLTMEDDAQLTTTAAWNFKKTAEIGWNACGLGDGDAGYGQIDLTITLDQRSPAVVKLSNSIQIKIDLNSSAFKCDMSPHKYPWYLKMSINPPREYLPSKVQGMRFNFQDVSLTLPELDFFATQNVFAPGQQAILAKSTISPYDFVIIGDIASPANIQPPIRSLPTNHQKQHAAWNRLQAPLIRFHLAKGRYLDSAPDVVRMKAMYDGLYTDDFGFAHQFTAALMDGAPDALETVFSKRGYDLNSVNACCMDSLSVPGPEFDLRFVGGAYKLDSATTESILFVDPKTRVIFLDCKPVVYQKVDQAGIVSFTDSDHRHVYSGNFTRTYNNDGEVVEDKFSAVRWPVNSPDSKEDVIGRRHYLLGNNSLKSKRKLRKLGVGPKATSANWTESPAFLTFAALLTIYTGVELTVKILKRAMQAKPYIAKLGQRIGLLQKDSESIIIEKMKKELAARSIDKKALSSVEMDIRRAVFNEVGIRNTDDATVRKAIIEAVAERGRVKTVESIMTQIQGEEFAAHSVVVAISITPEFTKAMKEACEEKFGDIINPLQWQDYLGSLVDTCIEEQKVTEASFDIKKIIKEVDDTAKKLKDVDEANAKFEADLNAARGKIEQETREDEVKRQKRLEELAREVNDTAKKIEEAKEKAGKEHRDATERKIKFESEYEKRRIELGKKTEELDKRKKIVFS